MKNYKTSTINRRQFLCSAGVSVAVFSILPGRKLRGAESISPNERVNVAGIGIGSRGGADVDEVAGLGHNLVALCDVDENYAAKRFAKYPDAKRFKDYRVMLDKMGKEVDAVVIGTPDHTHAVIAMEAMRRGKHVYCEKPLAHSVHEVRELMVTARKSKVVTQLGNQGHSSDTIRRVCEWVWAGALGKVHTIHAGCDAFKNVYCQIPNLTKIGEHHNVPKGLDYDPVKQGLTYPSAAKITFEFPARKARGPVKLVWHDGNSAIPKPQDFPADEKIPGTGAIMFGDKGMIVHGSHGGGNCHLLPEQLMDQYSGKNAPAQKIPRVKGHAWDWIEAIRTGRQAGSNFDYGGPLTQVAMLGLIAIRFPGQTLKWNDEQARFTNNDAANAYINPPYRPGWKL